MDQFTHKRLQDEAILRAQERASLRRPTRIWAGRPRLARGKNAALPASRKQRTLGAGLRSAGPVPR
jgi:hypothetical protein